MMKNDESKASLASDMFKKISLGSDEVGTTLDKNDMAFFTSGKISFLLLNPIRSGMA